MEEVKNQEMLKKYTALELIHKQHDGTITPGETAALNLYMSDPFVRSFVQDKIKQEVEKEAGIIVSAYNSSVPGQANKPSGSEEKEVKDIVSLFNKLNGTSSGHEQHNNNLTPEEKEVKDIVSLFNGSMEKEKLDPDIKKIVDSLNEIMNKEREQKRRY